MALNNNNNNHLTISKKEDLKELTIEQYNSINDDYTPSIIVMTEIFIVLIFFLILCYKIANKWIKYKDKMEEKKLQQQLELKEKEIEVYTKDIKCLNLNLKECTESLNKMLKRKY